VAAPTQAVTLEAYQTTGRYCPGTDKKRNCNFRFDEQTFKFLRENARPARFPINFLSFSCRCRDSTNLLGEVHLRPLLGRWIPEASPQTPAGRNMGLNTFYFYFSGGPLGLVMAISGLSRCHGCILRVCVITKNVPDVSGDPFLSLKK